MDEYQFYMLNIYYLKIFNLLLNLSIYCDKILFRYLGG